jgi:hypothetical protein
MQKEGLYGVCKFQFYVHFDPLEHRWYIPAHVSGHMQHFGHKRGDVDCVAGNINQLSNEERDYANKLLLKNVPLGTVACLLNARGAPAPNLSANQLTSLRNTVEVYHIEGDPEASVPITPAEKLISYLSMREDISFLAIYGELDTKALPVIKVRLSIRYCIRIEYHIPYAYFFSNTTSPCCPGTEEDSGTAHN